MDVGTLRRLALQLLQRQPAAFADLVNVSCQVEIKNQILAKSLVMVLLSGANVTTALSCQLRKKTSVAPLQGAHASPSPKHSAWCLLAICSMATWTVGKGQQKSRAKLLCPCYTQQISIPEWSLYRIQACTFVMYSVLYVVLINCCTFEF
jgi:hypothetical protein